MKVYVLYEMMYGELIQDTGDSANIIGVYEDVDKAIDVVHRSYIDVDVNEGYVLDEDLEKRGMITNKYGIWRMFWEHQENWNCYYEIVIEEKEVK